MLRPLGNGLWRSWTVIEDECCRESMDMQACYVHNYSVALSCQCFHDCPFTIVAIAAAPTNLSAVLPMEPGAGPMLLLTTPMPVRSQLYR